jgi:hypothetical protein
MFWTIPKMWSGDCWIIGGGNSMLKQFDIPAELITKVEKGEDSLSAFSPYLSVLHSKNVIGTNAAFMLGSWVSVAYFCDANFFRENLAEYLAFKNLKVTCSSSIPKEVAHLALNVKRVKRDYKSGISPHPDTICWNHNTGGAAINFAIWAGATRILLLGFDMDPEADKTHWHNLYSQKTNKVAFDRFQRYFPAIAEQAKQRGVEILNLSPDSKLEAFPKLSLKEVLQNG